MEVAVTRMAQNGQVVIPMEVRKESGVKPNEKFIVYFNGQDILLKPIEKDKFLEEMELLTRIKIAEDEVKNGKVTIVNSKMSEKRIDRLLMK